MDFLELIREGGITIYPLLLASVVSVAVIIDKFFEFYVIKRTVRLLHPQMIKLLESKDYHKMDNILSENIYCKNIYEAIIHNLDKPLEAIKKLAKIGLEKDAEDLRRYTWLLGTLGSLAPFIGLFGTVLGIMKAFNNIAAVGSGGFSVVASGISESLISTAAGLLVGVLSIFFYNFFTIKANHLENRLESNKEEMLVVLETRLNKK